jgi:hypothetical protein
VKYSATRLSDNSFNQNCLIELQTFDHRQIEVSVTAKDRRAALEMSLRKVYKHLQRALHKAQKYGRLSKNAYA